MFGWLKKKPNGPDFSGVDSREKAEALFQQGILQKAYLMPLEFGGQDSPLNCVFVPQFAAQLKAQNDTNIILPLAQDGKIKHYDAKPEYQGNSFVPIALRVTASDPGHFTYDIKIWGAALDRESPR